MATKTIYHGAYLQLVDKLRSRREELGVSQIALASKLGWPQQRVSAVEAGARRLDVLEFLRLASALGMTPEEGVNLLASVWDIVKVPPLSQ